jgi:hypothetical protein
VATDPRVETIRLLMSIDAKLGALLVALAPKVDEPQGDPVIKAKSPKDWCGDDMAGRKMSECPPAYLDMVAARADHFAQKNADAGDATKAGYDRRDAARARAWAAKLRAGYVPPTPDRVDESQGEPTW